MLAPLDRDPGATRRREKGLALAEYAANLDQCVARIVDGARDRRNWDRCCASSRRCRPTSSTSPIRCRTAAGSRRANRGSTGCCCRDRANCWPPWPTRWRPRAGAARAHGLLAAAAGAGGDGNDTTRVTAAPPLLPRYFEPSLHASCRRVAGRAAARAAARPGDLRRRRRAVGVGAGRLRAARGPRACGRCRRRLGPGAPGRPAGPAAVAGLVAGHAGRFRRAAAGRCAPAGAPGRGRAHGWTVSCPAGVYMCQGTEDARRHYEVLGRITDQALVLYQVRSPLPGDAT